MLPRVAAGLKMAGMMSEATARPRVVVGRKAASAVRRGHPWVFSGGVVDVMGQPGSGQVVEVVDESGEPLGLGDWSPRSQIRVRVFCRDVGIRVDRGFWRARLERARSRRAGVVNRDARREVYSDADGIPGLIVDRYGDFLAVRFLTAGAERRKGLWRDLLLEVYRPSGIWEQDDPARRLEGLEASKGLLAGRPPPDLLAVEEGPVTLLADLVAGQKTGLFLDQAENRVWAGGLLGNRDRVLDAFCHTGGFGLHGLVRGAGHVTFLDASGKALELARHTLGHNRVDPSRFELVRGDALQVLRRWRDEGRLFDAVVLDPPKFVPRAGALQRGTRGYKDVNWLAMRLLRPGGLLVTFSCSGLVDWQLHWQIVWAAAADAGREARVVARLGQGPDHPVPLHFPEAEYLTGFALLLD